MCRDARKKIGGLGALAVMLSVVIAGCGRSTSDSEMQSITDPDYIGKKYYLGWGAAAFGDPSNMHNEVKYDVLHTHDVFTQNIGGSYVGTKLIGSGVNGSQIRSQWTSLQQQIKPDDMYVQYSSGHGSRSGLMVGVTYNEMRDRALALKARETIIFTMACFSGNLVDSFNLARDQWQDFQSQGKTLLVVGSSQSGETSSTGPGSDPGEPNGPNGSAGSAFGHAMWKGIIGYADGAIDGVKDKKTTLEELLKFVIAKTKAIGGHTPKVTGVYDPKLVMTLTPSRAVLERLLGGTPEGLDALNEIINDGIVE